MNGYCRIRKERSLKQPVAKIRGVLKSCVSQVVWRTHTSNQPMMREEKPVA